MFGRAYLLGRKNFKNKEITFQEYQSERKRYQNCIELFQKV